jgi:bleomycin hydrolase
MGSSPSRPAHVASKLEPDTSVIAANDEEKRNENIHPLESAFAVLALSPGDPGDGSLSLENVAAWEKSIASNAKVQLARTVLSQTDIRSALASRSARIVDQHVFNNTLDFRSGPITNQKSSGRCWLFAATNVLRYEIMKKLKLNSFEFSQVRGWRTLACAVLTSSDHSRTCSSGTS